MLDPLFSSVIPDVSSEVSITNKSEYQRIVYDWNDTKRDFPHEKNLLTLFVEQVMLAPQHIAVVYHDQKLTYQALDEASTKLAHVIQQHYQRHQQSLTPDTLIALCMDRTPALFIGMIAILKTGAASVSYTHLTLPTIYSV